MHAYGFADEDDDHRAIDTSMKAHIRLLLCIQFISIEFMLNF